jgi:hypothetical protein
MNKKEKIAISYVGIGLCIIYFLVVVTYFLTNSLLIFKFWEVMIMLSAPIMLVILVSILENAEENKKGWKIIAIAFMVCTTVITTVAHYTNVISNNITRMEFQPNDTLAWGFFMGLAFIFASLTLPSKIAELKKIKGLIMICGILCLLGLIGPITNIIFLWFISVAGYGIGTPIICAKMISFYKKQNLN